MQRPHPPVRWDGLRQRFWRRPTIALRWLMCRDIGSTGFTIANRPSGSRWTWTVQSVQRTERRKTRPGTVISLRVLSPAARVFNQFGHLERCALTGSYRIVALAGGVGSIYKALPVAPSIAPSHTCSACVAGNGQPPPIPLSLARTTK
ncbi:MAG: hypothetical protein ACI8Q6_002776 [Granulosicoccus sp.]|jgi:hypothetical protein